MASEPKHPITHAELVQRAVKWLLGAGGCSIAFSEFSTSAIEIPDAIGFRSKWSIVIECKVSRSDFISEKNKPVRRIPKLAMGQSRYYMVPEGLIEIDDLPDKWGLLYVRERHVRVIKKSGGFADRNYMSEIGFLTSMLRRIKIRMAHNNLNAECLNH